MFLEYLQNALIFLQTNPIITVAIAVLLLALFYSKPKEMFKLAAFCLFIAVVFYFITLFTETINTGAQQKDNMSYKSKKVLGE
jgi:hypothetical protein